jgi:hypothetical protein
MGFSISWLAFAELSGSEVLERTGFRDTGVFDEANESRYSLAELPTGWTILFANDFDYGSAEHLVALSAGATVLSCQVEEHIMFSAAHCCEDARPSWSVWHDSQHGRYNLSTQGAPPPALAPIKRQMIAAQDRDGGARSIVDYIFDIPVLLAAELTGYRHDRSEFSWGTRHFTALERAR